VERLTDEEWESLLTEPDGFRLTIRGYAALEAEIDDYCEALFRTPLEGGMRGLGEGRRVAIASALGVIPEALLPAVNALRKVRNEFAHGNIAQLDDETLGALVRRLRGPSPELFGYLADTESPERKLAAILRFLRNAIGAAGVVMIEMRRQGETAIIQELIVQSKRQSGQQ
jgi:hypothetical protein